MARIFEVVLQQAYQSVAMLNTFTYLSGGEAVSTNLQMLGLANALGAVDTSGNMLSSFTNDSPLDLLQTMQPTSLTYVSLYITAPYDEAALFDEQFPAATTGEKIFTTDEMPRFIAMTLKGNRVKRDVRRSFKRFAGVQEDDIVANNLTSTFTDMFLTPVAQGFSNVISDAVPGVIDTYTPMTLKRTPEVNGEGKTVYVLPELEADAIAQSAVGISFTAQRLVTTQNSRKP